MSFRARVPTCLGRRESICFYRFPNNIFCDKVLFKVNLSILLLYVCEIFASSILTCLSFALKNNRFHYNE